MNPTGPHPDGPSQDSWPELRPVMADLAHVVHNASTLVLGHVAAVERTSPDDARLHDRVQVIEAALGRINDVVDGLRAAVDPMFWGDAEPTPVAEVVDAAFATRAIEGERRRIRLVDSSDADTGAALVVQDGARATAALGALVASALERLGSEGTITVDATTSASAATVQVSATRDDGLELHGGDARSVWEWVAAQLACQFGATVDRLDAATTAIVVPKFEIRPRP